jgi:hypothetical protein
MKGDPFTPIVAAERLSQSFNILRTAGAYAPARDSIRLYCELMPDPDGNFIEQFQTTGFDSRTWELYLFAVFHNHAFTIDRTQERPDFLLEHRTV